jgi:hypothetical protein
VLAVVPQWVIWVGSGAAVVAAAAGLLGLLLVRAGNKATRTKIHIDPARGYRHEGRPRITLQVHFLPFGSSWRVVECAATFRVGWHKKINWTETRESSGLMVNPGALGVFGAGRPLPLVVELAEDPPGPVTMRLRVKCADKGSGRSKQTVGID